MNTCDRIEYWRQLPTETVLKIKVTVDDASQLECLLEAYEGSTQESENDLIISGIYSHLCDNYRIYFYQSVPGEQFMIFDFESDDQIVIHDHLNTDNYPCRIAILSEQIQPHCEPLNFVSIPAKYLDAVKSKYKRRLYGSGMEGNEQAFQKDEWGNLGSPMTPS
jgi:hypothetical protein